jgi:hypothetical protein
MKKRHQWQSLNRDHNDPEDMMLNDLFEEIRCAVTEQDVQDLACMLDKKMYAAFGRRIGNMLQSMDGKPNNKISDAMLAARGQA